MAISKSKNKRNLAKRKIRKQNELKAEQLHNAVVIAAMTNTYENRLNELLKQNQNDIS
jgi:RNase P protein component